MNHQNEVKRVLQLITDKMMTRRYMNKVSRKQFKKKNKHLATAIVHNALLGHKPTSFELVA